MSQPIASAFVYCPVCKTKAKKTGVNPFQCHRCDFTFFFGPTTAVAAIVADDQGRVLLLERAKDPGKGLYGLPGGFVDVGEKLEEAVLRETLEELNLTAVKPEYLCSFPNVYVYKGNELPVCDTFFVCHIDSLDDLQLDAGEVASYKYRKLTPATLKKMAFISNRRALEFYRDKMKGGE